MIASSIDPDRLLKLRVVVARFGEMDLARWWNTQKQLGKTGAMALRRNFPRTYRFAQARSVFAVAARRCDDVFEPPRDAADWRLKSTVRRVQVILEEQLAAALSGLRDECVRLFGAGKKVVWT